MYIFMYARKAYASVYLMAVSHNKVLLLRIEMLCYTNE